MTPSNIDTGTTFRTLPYDNTALRERIGTTQIVARSVGAELHEAARAAVTAADPTRGRWSLRRRRP